MRRILPVIFCMALPSYAGAQAYEAINRLIVAPLSGGDFEVIEARGKGARGIWCAAADYALARGTRGSERMYVKTPRGASVSGLGRKGVVFTTDASSLGVPEKQSYSVSVRVAGLGLPVHHAHYFCRDFDFERESSLWYRLRR